MKKLIPKLTAFLISLIIFIGFPIISWGINDIELFFSNIYRTSYAIECIILSFLVVLFLPNEGRSVGEGVKLQKKHKLSLLGLQVFPLMIILIASFCDKNQYLPIANGLIRALGNLIFIFGFFLMNWSAYVLGKQFSVDVTIQKGHELITTGPFKIVRHPRYLGIMLTFLGISLIFNTYVSILIVVILILILLWRIHDEEKLMKDEFKEKWNEYSSRTRKLIPLIF